MSCHLFLLVRICGSMNQVNYQKAITYETLVTVYAGSEQKAEQALVKLCERINPAESFDKHIGHAGALLDMDLRVLRLAFDRVSRSFEQLLADDSILFRGDESWPLSLAGDKQEPMVLYGRGDMSLLEKPSVSVIGTRTPTEAGKSYAISTTRALGEAGYAITSGLALGIDGVAHLAAVAGGFSPLAVLGTSLGSVYPPEHKELQQEIGRKGLLITRFSPASNTQKWFFLLRNRLMSALSKASVIVEDRDGGGAVQQAKYALEQKKLVFLYQHVLENKGILWPRQFEKNQRVFVVRAPEDIPRLVTRLDKPEKATTQAPKTRQLHLFD